jgi:UDP-2-acetamido-3-amino-2,3-dideoxy-glucuronate N-acetyltransferase
MENQLLPPYQIIRDVKMHSTVRLWGPVNLYECEIGAYSSVGAFVEIQKKVIIGEKCKVSSHSFLCEGVVLKDEVFVGHGVMFTNDRFPRATLKNGELKGGSDWKCESTIVERRASIGSGATILCGITIGEEAVIGAGAVVTRSVAPRTIVAGNPARVIGKVEE